ncbi:MAG TPA: hypothetical protein VN033_10315 [Vulgatibacter sp.]|nr:hypothetical protein [Vulgatibacter sp.]
MPAAPAHVDELAPKLRPADAAEVLASGGFTPREALEESVRASAHAFAALFDGEVAGMWGVVDGPGCGIVWALTGPAVERHPKAFLRHSRVAVGVLLRHYPALVNYVDARYAAALRWVRRLGFEVGPPETFGAAGLLFHRILLRRGAACASPLPQP